MFYNKEDLKDIFKHTDNQLIMNTYNDIIIRKTLPDEQNEEATYDLEIEDLYGNKYLFFNNQSEEQTIDILNRYKDSEL